MAFIPAPTKLLLIGGLIANIKILFPPVRSSRCFWLCRDILSPPIFGKNMLTLSSTRRPFPKDTWILSLFGCVNSHHVLFLRQVDNFAIACSEESTSNSLLDLIDDELTIPVKQIGLLNLYNGLNIIQTCDYIKITCYTYIEKILEKHLLTLMKPFDIPAGRLTHLSSQESFMKIFMSTSGDPNPAVQSRLSSSIGFGYWSGIGELIYALGFGYQLGTGELIYALVTCRPDISYAVVCCPKNSICRAEINYYTVKHILKYLYEWLHTLSAHHFEQLPPCRQPSTH